VRQGGAVVGPRQVKGRLVRRLRDFAIYVFTGVVVVIIIWFAFHDAKTQATRGPVWFNGALIALTTVVVFGETIRVNRQVWSLAGFWSGILTAFIIQVCCGALILSLWRAPRFSLLLWAFFVVPFDFAVLDMYLSRWMGSGNANETRGGRTRG
jgi:lysylphosphatidylglycerol synthetase-like protein (DUF2156 family)